MTRPRVIAALTIGALAVALLSGCTLFPTAKSPSAPPASGGASGGGSASLAAAGLPQQPMKGVPTTCPSVDVIAISVHVSLPILQDTPQDDGLECTYVNAASKQGLELIFGSAVGVTEQEWAAKVTAADSSSAAVSGVGDGAFYGVKEGVGYMWFYSGAVAGYVYSALPIGSQANLTALLADQIFVPD